MGYKCSWPPIYKDNYSNAVDHQFIRITIFCISSFHLNFLLNYQSIFCCYNLCVSRDRLSKQILFQSHQSKVINKMNNKWRTAFWYISNQLTIIQLCQLNYAYRIYSNFMNDMLKASDCICTVLSQLFVFVKMIILFFVRHSISMIQTSISCTLFLYIWMLFLYIWMLLLDIWMLFLDIPDFGKKWR